MFFFAELKFLFPTFGTKDACQWCFVYPNKAFEKAIYHILDVVFVKNS